MDSLAHAAGSNRPDAKKKHAKGKKKSGTDQPLSQMQQQQLHLQSAKRTLLKAASNQTPTAAAYDSLGQYSRSDSGGSSNLGGGSQEDEDENVLFRTAQEKMREMYAMQRAGLQSRLSASPSAAAAPSGALQSPHVQQLQNQKQKLLQQMKEDTASMQQTIRQVHQNEHAMAAASGNAGAVHTTSPAAAANADANDLVYKALMNHKKAELQKMVALASDTQTITDAMIRRHAEAQRTKIAVAACTHYATNSKYIEVNSGNHPKIRVFNGMHALNPDEVDVYSSLVECCPPQSHAMVTVMHNHCMSDQGMIEGFRFTMGPKENHQYLPMNRRMFFRHSMVECTPLSPLAVLASSRQQQQQMSDAQLLTSCQEDRTILELLLRQNEVKDKLVSIMQRLYKGSLNGMDADFDCMPMNMDVLDSAHASMELQGGGLGSSSSSSSMAASFHARRTADCKKWNPEMPEILGLYHAYVRGYNKDTRWVFAVH